LIPKIGKGLNGEPEDDSTINTVNPILRDTQDAPPKGWILIRFVADNPGMWLFQYASLSLSSLVNLKSSSSI